MARRGRNTPRSDRLLRIDRINGKGKGEAEFNGQTVAVADALPGETVVCAMSGHPKQDRVVPAGPVVVPSRDRVLPACTHFGTCGGCALQHLEGAAQLAHKQRRLTEGLTAAGVTAERDAAPIAGPLWGYRRRARLGARLVTAKGRVLVGFRERGSSFVTDMADCRVLVPAAARLLEPLSHLIGGMSIAARVPQVELSAGDDTVALVVRHLDPLDEADVAAMRRFAERHDVVFYLQPGGPESIAPLDPEPRPLTYRLPEFDLEFGFSPTDFVQINGAMNRILIRQAVDLLAPTADDTVLDLFCGLGNFTLPLARRAGRVIGVEWAGALVERAVENARRNAVGNVDFHAADLNVAVGDDGAAWLPSHVDKVLVDPPRTGAEAVLPALAALGPERIVYVSCIPETLSRDAAALVGTHGYRLISACAVDMFPHTGHAEALACFERR